MPGWYCSRALMSVGSYSTPTWTVKKGKNWMRGRKQPSCSTGSRLTGRSVYAARLNASATKRPTLTLPPVPNRRRSAPGQASNRHRSKAALRSRRLWRSMQPNMPLARYRAKGIFGCIDRHSLLERKAAFERCRLLSCPGADLRLFGTGGKVSVGLFVADAFNRAAYTDLPVNRLPVEHEGCLRPRIQFLPFLTVHVGVEYEPTLINALEQYHPGIGKAARIDGGKRHRCGISRFRGSRFRQPRGK